MVSSISILVMKKTIWNELRNMRIDEPCSRYFSLSLSTSLTLSPHLFEEEETKIKRIKKTFFSSNNIKRAILPFYFMRHSSKFFMKSKFISLVLLYRHWANKTKKKLLLFLRRKFPSPIFPSSSRNKGIQDCFFFYLFLVLLCVFCIPNDYAESVLNIISIDIFHVVLWFSSLIFLAESMS